MSSFHYNIVKKILYNLLKQIRTRPRNRSPLSRVLGKRALTTRPKITEHPNPYPFLVVNLTLIPRDGYITDSTIQFFDDGTASRTTLYRPAESPGYKVLPRPERRQFRKDDGSKLYRQFVSLNTHTWKKRYIHYDQINDGMEWSLTIENSANRRRKHSGYMLYPPEWEETCALFGLQSGISHKQFILSD